MTPRRWFVLAGAAALGMVVAAIIGRTMLTDSPATTVGPATPTETAAARVASVPMRTPSVTPSSTPQATSIPASPPMPGPFLETFDGAPGAPRAWGTGVVAPAAPTTRWDVVVHSRDRDTWDQLEPMVMGHGPGCEAPPAHHSGGGTYEDAVFQCRDHVMTSIKAGGYGVIYLTPNALADWSEGEALIRFDVSTLRTSDRDWWDVWLTPWDDALSLPLDEGLPDLQGPPRNAIQFRLSGGHNAVCPALVRDFKPVALAPDRRNGCLEREDYDKHLTPSPATRTTFEIRVSKTHLKVGIPSLGLWWFNRDIPELPFERAVVQIGHHSYNPEKACDGDGSCSANTWHWDNVAIAPSLPFAMVKADQRYADAGTPALRLEAPAPERAYLRFAGIGAIDVSFDSGRTWQPARKQAQLDDDPGHFASYWMPVPAGVQQLIFRGQNAGGHRWRVNGVSAWSDAAAAASPPVEASSGVAHAPAASEPY